MSNFGFYADAGLTVPIDTDNRIEFVQVASGAPADALVYFGSPDATRKVQAASTPGVDNIAVQVLDADIGAGLAVGAVRLALSFAGLGAATPGAALDIGTTINGGSANAVPIFVRVDAASAVPLVDEDLSLRAAGMAETAL